MLAKIQETAEWIKNHTQMRPLTAIVLGTGLGRLAAEIEIVDEFPYQDIPNFPVSTVEGHSGKLIFGRLGGKDVMALQGRFHYYEGYDMKQVTFPVRVMYELGIQNLFVSNASGGMNPNFEIGDLMLITDHINFMGANPLRGTNDDSIGPRFCDMTHTYTPELQEKALSVAKKQNILLQKGVYLGYMGPSFETPAEIRAFRVLGADAVGMSTVPEAIAASHCGLPVVALSLITNMAAGMAGKRLDGAEVIEIADQRGPVFQKLVKGIVEVL